MTKQWKREDHATLPVTAAEIQAILRAMRWLEYSGKIFDARAHRDAMAILAGAEISLEKYSGPTP